MPTPWSISEGIRSGYNNGAAYQPWPQSGGHEGELAELRDAAQGLLHENDEYKRAIAERDAAIAERDRQMGKMMAHIRELEAQRGEFYQKWIDCANDLARAVTSRDRYQANGKRVKAEKLELEAALRLPGVLKAARRAAQVATHPDRATSDGERLVRTEWFQRATAAFDRLEGGGS
jgi:hypothetical protein